MNEVCLGSEEFTICENGYDIEGWIWDTIESEGELVPECARIRITVTHIIEDEEVATTEP